VKDSLLLCEAAWPIMDSFNTPDHVGDPSLESKIFSAVTGVETDEAGLNIYGERIFNLQRAILLREGWKAKEDDYPPDYNFTEPVYASAINPRMIVPGPTEEPVSFKGNILDREKYEEMRSEFYELRGWDPETGLQKAETLERLDMSDLARDLKGLGLLK
jgi:aldehyde:ferredoxin oxidoreductase